MNAVFRALADPTRRSLLDELFREDGQTLSALEERFSMTRFGVMKHLKQLEQAGLVVTRRRGREKLFQYVGGLIQCERVAAGQPE
jgi:DNA-binding transcriptional ArsR family regulator